jgi:type I restriction enzyme S subunit
MIDSYPWKTVPFESAVMDLTGGQPKVQKREYLTNGSLPVIDQGQELIAGYTNDCEMAYKGPLPVVLFGDHTRIFKYVDFPFALGADGVKVLVPKEAFNPKFLFFYCQSVQIPSRGYSRHFKFLREVYLPCFPLSEQRRIVESLDQADALRKKRAKADAKAERILRALFIKMFGDPATNAMGWAKVALSDFAVELRYGTSTRCTSESNGLPVLRIPNILHGEVDLSDLKYAELPAQEIERLLLEHGDLLFVRTNGNRDYVGRCAVFALEAPYLFASYLIRARLQQEKVDPWYVVVYLHTPAGRRAMSSFIRTTAGQSNISLEGLRQIPIPLPPLPMQRQFREHVEHLYLLRQEREKSGNSLNTTFSCLLHRAFSGALTAKWREDHMKELLTEMEQQAKYLAEGGACRHLENIARQESLF